MLVSSWSFSRWQFIRDSPDDVVIEDIGDGYMNYVLRVHKLNERNTSVVVKHAPPYFKVSYIGIKQHSTLAKGSSAVLAKSINVFKIEIGLHSKIN